MSMGQMLLVLLGLVLFSTMIISFYSVFINQMQALEFILYRMQGLKIVDFNFQKIEAELISNSKSFATLYDEFANNTSPVDTFYVNQIPYVVYIKSIKSTVTGSPVTGATSYMRIDVKAVCRFASNDSLEIGRESNPISKVFGDIFGPGVN